MIVFSRPPGRKRRAVPFLCRNAMRSKGIEGEGSDGDGAPAARANAPYALSGTTKNAPPPPPRRASARAAPPRKRRRCRPSPLPRAWPLAKVAIGEKKARQQGGRRAERAIILKQWTGSKILNLGNLCKFYVSARQPHIPRPCTPFSRRTWKRRGRGGVFTGPMP